jgi:hypothetical protein
MKSIELDTFFGDKPVHIEISAPMGAGGATYHIMVDKYFHGTIMKNPIYSWFIYIQPQYFREMMSRLSLI